MARNGETDRRSHVPSPFQRIRFMKKTVLTFGIIAGVILSAMLFISMSFHDVIGFDKGLIIGYTSMVLAFLLIYFGVRSYRDNVGGGTVSFGRAFAVGELIAVVAAALYAISWEIMYPRIASDYMAKYQAHTLAKAQADGESAEEIAAQKAEMDKFAQLYRNRAVRGAFSFLEPMPVALIISLISAGIL